MKKTFYSTVSPDLLRKSALHLSLFGALGFLPLLCSAIFLPKESLQWAGPLLFLLWLTILFPLTRRWALLRKIDRHPTKVEIDEETLFFQGRPVCPLHQIANVHFFQQDNTYGLAIDLKNNQSLKFPFFNEATCSRISECIVSNSSANSMVST